MPQPSIQIRDFQPADAQRVNEISVAAFGLLSHRYSDWSAMSDRIVTTSRLAAEMPMYVALYNGTVADSVALTPPGGPRPDFFDSDCAVIRMLVVDPPFHGKGIGSALLDHCIETARLQNYGRIHLHTSTAMEVALPLYLRRGFVFLREAPPVMGLEYSQVLLLPQEYHLPGEEVYISRKGDSIILSPVVTGVQSLWAVLEGFSGPIERSQPEQYDQRSAIDPA